MAGNGGVDQLFDSSGNAIQSESGQVDDAFKEYLEGDNSVWYYKATDQLDRISIDFIPGTTGSPGHHLITRETCTIPNNPQSCQFAADLKLVSSDDTSISPHDTHGLVGEYYAPGGAVTDF